MSDKKQPETEQPRQQNKGWPWVKGIIWPWVKGIIWLWVKRIIMIALGGSSLFICWFYLSPERRAANDHTALIAYLIGLAITGGVVLCIPRIITSNPKKYFITRVLTTGITGGAFALLLPIAVKSTTTGVGGLRHSILLATGGLLAILTLGETRRKNDIDKRKNKQEKKKNDREHLRQVRAERRERYTKAVEQLGDEKAPVRMGGVYTLVGLVDEWLEEESLSENEKLKEGQVIVNNLCAYIRSPFTLTSYYDELSEDAPSLEGSYKDKKEEFYVDKAILDSEADVRLSIIKEIHDRIQVPDKNTPGAWSDFEYNFSGSIFFYSVDLTNSYYTKYVNFSGATYQDRANFRGSTYQGRADFSDSTYQAWASFNDSTYKDVADFRGSTYQGRAEFTNSTYQVWAYFSGSTYQGRAEFTNSTYENETDFSGSIFYQETCFGEDIYSNSSSCFTNHAPQFYDKTNHKNTLFGSHNNDFTVDIDKGYPIDLDSKGIPLNCKFLTSEQKEYLEGKLQEIEKINNKLREVKDLKEKAELSEKLRDLNNELHKWRNEATTVKVEDVATEDTES